MLRFILPDCDMSLALLADKGRKRTQRHACRSRRCRRARRMQSRSPRSGVCSPQCLSCMRSHLSFWSAAARPGGPCPPRTPPQSARNAACDTVTLQRCRLGLSVETLCGCIEDITARWQDATELPACCQVKHFSAVQLWALEQGNDLKV